MIPIRLTGLPPHGTITRYGTGCRCSDCRAADTVAALDPDYGGHREAERLNQWISAARAAAASSAPS